MAANILLVFTNEVPTHLLPKEICLRLFPDCQRKEYHLLLDSGQRSPSFLVAIKIFCGFYFLHLSDLPSNPNKDQVAVHNNNNG